LYINQLKVSRIKGELEQDRAEKSTQRDRYMIRQEKLIVELRKQVHELTIKLKKK